MVITYSGNGSFRLQSGDTALLLNPENNRSKADVIIRTLAGVKTAELLEQRFRRWDDDLVPRRIRISRHRDNRLSRSWRNRLKVF